jgi:hypothetical protein
MLPDDLSDLDVVQRRIGDLGWFEDGTYTPLVYFGEPETRQTSLVWVRDDGPSAIEIERALGSADLRRFLGPDGLARATREIGPPTEIASYGVDNGSVIGNEFWLNITYGRVVFFCGRTGTQVYEVRISEPDTGFTTRGIGIGDPLDELVTAFPETERVVTVSPESDARTSNVLFLIDDGGSTGEARIAFEDLGVRFFMEDGAVAALYIFTPSGGRTDDGIPVEYRGGQQ